MNDETPGRLLSLPQAPDAIELRHLRAFIAVADELNFGRAAARLYLSQPALSRQIRALERLLGCDLLRRSTHQVELTLAGDALLDRARRLLTDLDDAVSTTQSVGGELTNRAARMWEPVADHNTAEADLQELSAAYEALLARSTPPPETQVRPVRAGGVPSLLVTPDLDRPPTLLYLHGGGYMMGSAFGYRPLVGALAAATETTALVPDYRLAPEHPFPAAIDDAVSVYRWMLDQGTPPHLITVAGDSSGAGLTLALLLRLRKEAVALPGRTLLLCPWVDLGFTLPPRTPSHPQLVITSELMRRNVDLYLDGQPADDPMINPLTADLTGLPPMLIQAGTGDHLLMDSQRLTDRARDHGVDATLELYPADTHGFHLFWSFLPEAIRAIEQAGLFVRRAAGTGTGAARPDEAM